MLAAKFSRINVRRIIRPTLNILQTNTQPGGRGNAGN
jgi:hypothetical protein